MTLEDQDETFEFTRTQSISSSNSASRSESNDDGHDITGRTEIQENVRSIRGNINSNVISAIDIDGGPKEPSLSSIEARLSSYKSWPPGLEQRPYELASAGFYYTGYSDKVMCFYCGGGLEAWEPQDSVLSEHKKWFGSCAFVRLTEIEHNSSLSIKSSGNFTRRSFSHVEGKETHTLTVNKYCGLNKTVDEPRKYMSNELEELRYRQSCKVCLENEVAVVFLPCNHLVTCTSCALALKNCPLCRRNIEQLLRTFLS